jgi:hypothetical protein
MPRPLKLEQWGLQRGGRGGSPGRNKVHFKIFYRLCVKQPTGSFLSETNEAMVIFLGQSSSAAIRYRFDPPNPVPPPPTPSTSTKPPATRRLEYSLFCQQIFLAQLPHPLRNPPRRRTKLLHRRSRRHQQLALRSTDGASGRIGQGGLKKCFIEIFI